MSWIVLYNDECGFCATALAAILIADRRHRLRPLALGTPEADDLISDLTPAQRDASWHLIAPDGRRESAGAAGPPLLRLLAGGQAPARLLARFPGQTECAYEWVADRRATFSRVIPNFVKERATRLIERRG